MESLLTDALPAEDNANQLQDITQEDIDAVLTRGSGMYHGKYRIFDQYLKKENAEANTRFLKNEYGLGGCYPAVADRGLDECHDAKGIKISRGSISEPKYQLLLPWNKVEKRIHELINAGLYLSQKEIDYYPVYHAKEEERKARWLISNNFRAIITEYNYLVSEQGAREKMLNQYYLSGCWAAFAAGDKKMHCRTAQGDFIIPMMRDAMQAIISDNTHLTERCRAMLDTLSGDLAKALEPTPEELDPAPVPNREYRIRLGDTVYMNELEYEVLSIDGNEITLSDKAFPLFMEVLLCEELSECLKKSIWNDKFLRAADEHFISTAEQVRIPA